MSEPILKELAPDLWVADGQADAGMPDFFKKYDFSTRMTVIRLEDGGLFLHSPVRLTDALRSQLDAVGTVRVVVAPNRSHHLFAGEYQKAFLDARLYGALGLQVKRKDLRFFAMLGDEPMPEWRGQIEQHLVKGVPALNEVVFFHLASRTLLLSDLAFNVAAGRVWGIPVVFKLMGAEGRFGPHRIVRWMIRDRKAMVKSLRRIQQWDFERIVVAHGDVVERGGRQMLAEGFSFLLDH